MSAVVTHLAIKRKGLPFQTIFISFMIFILVCGTTRLLGAAILWEPVCRLNAAVNVVTALPLLPTTIALLVLLPTTLALPSQGQLKAANPSRLVEIEERRRIEQDIRQISAYESVRSTMADLQSIPYKVPDTISVVRRHATTVREARRRSSCTARGCGSRFGLYQARHVPGRIEIASGTGELGHLNQPPLGA